MTHDIAAQLVGPRAMLSEELHRRLLQVVLLMA